MSSLLDCDCPQYGTAELILILELQLLITAESKRTGSFDCCICKGDSPSLHLILQLFVLTVSLLCLCSPLWAASWKLQASASLVAVLHCSMEGVEWKDGGQDKWLSCWAATELGGDFWILHLLKGPVADIVQKQLNLC